MPAGREGDAAVSSSFSLLFFFSLLNNMIFKVPQDFLLRRTEKRTVTRDTISILNFGRQFAILDVPVSAISP